MERKLLFNEKFKRFPIKSEGITGDRVEHRKSFRET